MYRSVRELTPDRLYECALDLYRDMLAAGTTTVCEFHYVHHLYRGTPEDSARAVARAARDVGIRQTLLPVLYRYGGFGRRTPSEAQRAFVLTPESCLDLIERLKSDEDPLRHRVGYAPHSLRAVDHDDLVRLLEHRADATDAAPFHIHVSEQVREINEAVLALGSRPVAWLFDRFDPDTGWCLVHATHMDEDERSRLAVSEAVVALCPTTEADLGDGVFPLGDFLEDGGTFGLGSDSNLTVSAAEEIRLLDFQNRLLTRRRNAFSFAPGQGASVRPATRLWLESLRGAARATGLPVGAVEPGYAADFVSLSADHPLALDGSADDVLAAFVYSAGSEMIERVYIGGRAT
ncbi:MAG: amidohydrolase family protein [Rhodothermales bacterium]|nr:amidohydrolase family protein [Rhodothermales bacterium]